MNDAVMYYIEAPGRGYFQGLAIAGKLLPTDRPVFDAVLIQRSQPSFGTLMWTTAYKDAADGIVEILRGRGINASVKRRERAAP